MGLESQTPLPKKEFKKPISMRERIVGLTKSRIIIGAISLASMGGAYYNQVRVRDYSDLKTFNSAFKKARGEGRKVFFWNGKEYSTELVSKEISDTYLESKKFLEDYYNSAYFKSKQPINKTALSNDIAREREFNKRYKELDKKIIAHGGTLEELEEWSKIGDYYFNSENEEHKNEVDRREVQARAKISGERIEKLKNPTYFSITEQKGDMKEDGGYKTDNKKVFIFSRPGSGNDTTSVHELTHKSTNSIEGLLDNDQFLLIRERARDSINSMTDQQYDKYSKKSWEYLVSTTEIDARQNSTRFWLYKNFPGYKADTVFENQHYDFLVHNYSGLPYDIQQLMDVFPARDIFIKNMNDF